MGDINETKGAAFMNKPRFETPNLTVENIAKLAELFPGVVAEGKVNFDLLRSMLGEEVFGDEAYEFTWVGKRAAIAEAGRPIRKTLRPCVEESKDWDTTENLYIEGDNLDVLKLLQESYLGKVKMIYIDPPYNTGNDFIYRDDFSQSREDYDEETGVYDEDGDRLFRNTETNGRFHSDWCSMIYPRLVLARNLLRDDGVIFISIDDNEVAQLRKICDEIFSESNFEGHIHWRRRHNQPNDKTKMIGLVGEHIIAYAKDKFTLKSKGVGKIDLTGDFSNSDNDPRGDWASKPWKVGSDQSGSRYTIVAPNGNLLDENWMGEEATYKQLLDDKRIYFPRSGDGLPRKKYFRHEREEEGQCATNWWEHQQFGHNQGANDCVTALFGAKNVFSNPKPIELVRGLIQISNAKDNDIILDFFSGSSTTAHAVMQLNSEDGKNRRFIMVQYQEDLEKNYAIASGKAKAQIKVSIDFLNSIGKSHFITEIGKERICRAGNKSKADTDPLVKNIDIGFRVLKLDDTNMNDVYYSPSEYTQDMLQKMESNIKPNRTDLDLLYGCLLDWGLPLSMSHTHEKIDGFTVHTYNKGDLIACFDEHISEKAIREIAGRKPLRAVFRDGSFTSSPQKINVFEIFKLLAPNTTVKVI